MNTKKQEQLFKQFEPMIYKKSWKFSRLYGMDFDDMVGQAHLIFVEACNDFDDIKSCFSTFLFQRLEGKLNAYARTNLRWNTPKIETNKVSHDDNVLDKIIFNEKLSKLSDLATQIVSYVMTPNDSENESKITKKVIENHFSEKGYPFWVIRHSFSEIQGVL